MRASWQVVLQATVRHVVLATTSALVLLPFLWMIGLSIAPAGQIFGRHFSLQPSWSSTFENYRAALTAPSLLLSLSNGIIVCIAILVAQLAICVPAGYAFAKLQFRGRRMFSVLLIIGLLIPQQVLAIPQFLLLAKLSLLNTYAALILPFVSTPFGIFLFRQFATQIPNDTIAAARLDGLSERSIVWHIVLPAMLPGILAFSTLSVVAHWNDLFWPLIAVRSPNLTPPSLGLLAFRNQESGTNYGPLMAAAAIVIAPLILLFVGAQESVVVGVTGKHAQSDSADIAKRKLPWLTVAIACVLGVCALVMILQNRPHSTAPGTRVLRVAPYPLVSMPLYQKVSQDFERSHPRVHVQLNTPAAEWDAQLERTVLDASMNIPVDVAFESFPRIEAIASRHLAVPLDSFIASNRSGSLLSAHILSLGQFDGQTWGLPLLLSVPVVYYNLDIIRQAGGNPTQLPKTWDGIENLAKQIRQRTYGNLGIYFDYGATGNWALQALVESSGGRLYESDGGRVTIDRSKWLEALQILHSLGTAGQLDMSKEQALQAFAAGSLGIFVGSSQQLANLTKQSGGRFQIVTMPFPLSSANAHLPVGGGVAMMLTRDPVQQQLAWEYLKYLVSAEVQARFSETTSYLPVDLEAAKIVPAFRDYALTHPAAITSAEELDIGDRWRAFPEPNSVQISYVIREYLRQVITLRRSPEDALNSIERDIQDLTERR